MHRHFDTILRKTRQRSSDDPNLVKLQAWKSSDNREVLDCAKLSTLCGNGSTWSSLTMEILLQVDLYFRSDSRYSQPDCKWYRISSFAKLHPQRYPSKQNPTVLRWSGQVQHCRPTLQLQEAFEEKWLQWSCQLLGTRTHFREELLQWKDWHLGSWMLHIFHTEQVRSLWRKRPSSYQAEDP